MNLRKDIRSIEKRIISDRLGANRWNVAATADELGLKRTTLWEKMKVLGIRRPDGMMGTPRRKPKSHGNLYTPKDRRSD